jgi:NAD+ kinase
MERIVLFENQNKPDAVKYAEYTANLLFGRGKECYVSHELYKNFSDEFKKFVKPIIIGEFERFIDAIITFGGDGTILSAVRQVTKSEIPIMGINVGKLGFLAEFQYEKISEAIESLLSGEYRMVDRTMLSTKVNGEVIYALNDIVVEKMSSSRMITLHCFSDDNFVASYRADGLIVTTPTGSTAYSLASGGPILAPSTRVICLTPIAPHSLTFRPLVIPDENTIRLIVESPNGEAKLVADGQVEKFLKTGDEVIISLAEEKVKLIKPRQSSYYDVLRAKLLWAADPTSHKPFSEH